MKPSEDKHKYGLMLAGTGFLIITLLGVVSVCTADDPSGSDGLQHALSDFLSHLNDPLSLGLLLLSLYLSPYLPRLVVWVGSAAGRLTKIEVGDVAIELSASPTGESEVALALADDPGWATPRSLWSGDLPESEGTLEEDFTNADEDKKAAFDQWPVRANDFVKALPDPPLVKSDRAEWFKKKYREFEVLERGWEGEHVSHLERSAELLMGAMDVGLEEGLGKTLLFRRLMLVEHALRRTKVDDAEVAKRVDELVECFPKLGNEVRRGFYTRPAAAGLLLLLVRRGDSDGLRCLAKDAGMKWVGGTYRRASLSLQGVEIGFSEAAKAVKALKSEEAHSLEPLWTLLRHPVAGPRSHRAFRVVRHLLRAEVADQLSQRCTAAESQLARAYAVKHSRAVLRVTASLDGFDFESVRTGALRILARNWQLGHFGVDSLLAEAPDLMTHPAALNDLARSVLAAGSTPADVSVARRLLQTAAALPTEEADGTVIQSNLKELET